MTFTSPSETRFRSLRPGSSPAGHDAEAPSLAGLVPSFLSWGFQRSPLRRIQPVRPLPAHLPKVMRHRLGAAMLLARSVLAVSTTSTVCPAQALLVRDPRIATGTRPWGSPRFGRTPPGACNRRERRLPVPAGVHRSQWRSALRSVPLDSSSSHVTVTDALSPLHERSVASGFWRKRLLPSVPPRTSRPQGLVPLPSPLPSLPRKRRKAGPMLPWASKRGSASGFPTWTCGGRPWLRRR